MEYNFQTVIIVLYPSLLLSGILGPSVLAGPAHPGPRGRLRKSCSASIECPGKQCCRNDAGNPVNNEGWENNFEFLDTETGTCSPRKSEPEKRCTPDRCDCGPGYECYRTVTGACCAPFICWLAEDAEIDREYWDNCNPPDCYFPP